MKFTYDTKTDDRECVAYISEGGGLVIPDGDCGATLVYSDGSGTDDTHWMPEVAVHKFYKGDSVTITF